MSICVKWDVGAHTPFCKRICDTLWTSVCKGMYTTQFFLGSAQTYKRAVITDEDIRECKKILQNYPLHVFTHFPYVTNLAGTVKSLGWNGDKEQDSRLYQIIKALEYELGVIGELSLSNYKSGVVIHPGSFPDRKKGLQAIVKTINKINFPKNSVLLLENSAGAGTTLATTFSELKEILDGIEEEKKSHVKICLDTCHIYAYGTYNLSEEKEVEKMFRDFDTVIGLNKLSLIHLNDSESKMGTKTDRHACLGTGYIWGQSFSSLKTLLNLCEKNKIPLMLETEEVDMITLSELSREK